MNDNSCKPKLAFFVNKNLDSFLGDVISALSEAYETRKIIVSDLKQIGEGMEWSDICWFEWCDNLIIYASKLPIAQNRKIICRLHSYEAFAGYPARVNWSVVDTIVFVSPGIQEYTVNKYKIDRQKTQVIPNGIDLNKYSFQKRNHGFRIAYVGYINYKKGPMLLIHTFKAMLDHDSRYGLYIAGLFQDDRYVLYFKQMMEEWGIRGHVCFCGWQKDLNHWLDDKNYILCSSVLESQNVSVMQAMAKGIKPIIHNFVGAGSIYPKEYLFNSISEAVDKLGGAYNSAEYRKFIEDHYSLEKQKASLNTLLSKIAS
jgi:glycosyltransferase involved in cell wall biosynthesis